MPTHQTIKQLLATVETPPPTADFSNVQRGLLRALGGYNAADQIVENYKANVTEPPPTRVMPATQVKE